MATSALMPPQSGSAFRLDLGAVATREFIGGRLDALYAMRKDWGKIGAFGSAWYGARRFGHEIRRDAGAAAGIRVEF